MIEVIASLYDSVTNKLVSAKSLKFPDSTMGRLTVMWAVRGKEGIGYSECICRDLPVCDRSPAPTEGVSTKVDWVP